VAEPSITIVAASIPVLRALIKEIKTSGARYFGSDRHSSGPKGTGQSGTKGPSRRGGSAAFHQSNIVTTVTGQPKDSYDFHRDTGSDKSILEAPAAPGQIRQTQEVRLSYHDRSDNDSVAYEMDVVGNRRSN
jgi:hypothetical protein